MRRAVALLAPLLLGPLLLGTLLLGPFAAPGLAAGETGETKTFAEQNFKWTLPSKDWSFVETSAGEKRDGYVARAVKRLGSDPAVLADVFAYVAPTGGLTLAERMKELGDAAASDMDVVVKRQSLKAKLSGLDGGVEVVRGDAKSGGKAVFLYYGIQQKDVFHHLLVKSFQGAGTKFGAEIDALRRSYRLIQGAGPDEAPAAAGKSLVEIEAKADGEGGGGGGDAKPAAGATREGNVFSWPDANVKWTIPATPEWNAKQGRGEEKLNLGLRLPGIKEPPPPGMQPDDTVPAEGECEVHFSVRPAPAGRMVHEILKDPEIQQQLAGNFDKPDPTKTQLQPEVPVGNWKGAAVQMVGLQGDSTRFLRVYLVQLRGMQYQWTCVMEGEKNVNKVFSAALKDLLAGIAFVDTKEGVRGPVSAAGIPDHVVTRGKPGEGKEKAYSGVAAKRPKDWYELDNNNGENGHQFSWESRSADGATYQYLTLRVLRADDLGNIKLEDLVEKRQGVWKQAVSDPVTEGKGAKLFFDTTLRGAKGVGYRFSGTFAEIPFVETGWIVKNKGLVFVVYHQYGGKDADKMADKAAGKVDAFIRFEK